jgi:topoisomerase-4 subunit A
MKHQPGGGKGVILMGLAEGEELVAASIINQAKVEVTGSTGAREHTVKLSGETLQSYFGKRARGGKSLPAKFKPKRID